MKKFVKFAFVAAFATIAGYCVYSSQRSEIMSDLALSNVEALADNESTAPCKGYGSVLCTYNNIWVYSQE